MNTLDKYWDALREQGVEEQTLQIVTSINGYTKDTLESVLFAHTGYRSFDQDGAVEDPRDLVEFDENDEGVKWFLNEEGFPYPYPANLQRAHYPNDFHTAYETEREAQEAADALTEETPAVYRPRLNELLSEESVFESRSARVV